MLTTRETVPPRGKEVQTHLKALKLLYFGLTKGDKSAKI
jgi:hypothetical protein